MITPQLDHRWQPDEDQHADAGEEGRTGPPATGGIASPPTSPRYGERHPEDHRHRHDETGRGDVRLDLVGADHNRPHRGPGRPRDPRRPKRHEKQHRGDDEVRVPRLAQRSDRQAEAVQVDRRRHPQGGDRTGQSPQDSHRGDQGRPADGNGAEKQAGATGPEHPHEWGQEIKQHGSGVMEPDAAVRPHQLVEMDGAASAELEKGLVPIQDHVPPLDDDPDRLRHRDGRHGCDGQPPDPVRRGPPCDGWFALRSGCDGGLGARLCPAAAVDDHAVGREGVVLVGLSRGVVLMVLSCESNALSTCGRSSSSREKRPVPSAATTRARAASARFSS